MTDVLEGQLQRDSAVRFNLRADARLARNMCVVCDCFEAEVFRPRNLTYELVRTLENTPIAANPLLAAFQDLEGQANSPRLESFDWREHGVSIPYVIFIAGRCGSTLLTHLLKASGLCGIPDEFFNNSHYYNVFVRAKTFSEYFSGVVRMHSSHGRFGFQIDPLRFVHLKQSIDFFNVFPRPTTPLFWMTRRDIVAQAWSFAKAKITGVWHAHQLGLVTDVADKRIVTDRDIWREIALILHSEQMMENFFSEYSLDPCRIDYEMLVADRNATVIRVMQRLDCPVTGVIDFLARRHEGTERLIYPDRDAFIARFIAKFQVELEEIEIRRKALDVGKLQKRLAAEFGILP